MITHRGKQWHEQAFAICMAWDAFRIALGGKPEHFTLREIIAWLTVRHTPNPSR